jgi:hypothetical protein
MQREVKNMTDDFTKPLGEPSTAAKVADGIKTATGAVSDAIETGLEPGMPLDIVVKAVREAPLAALGIAFMVGLVFASPRR